APAEAKPTKATGFSARMVLRGSHGYRIEIEGAGRAVDLIAASGSDAEAEYRVTGRVTAHGMKANFGRLGLVKVRFGGGTPTHHTHGKGCLRESVTIERGTFTGTIRFHGEHGFTSLSRSHAHGTMVRNTSLLCLAGTARGALHPRPASG